MADADEDLIPSLDPSRNAHQPREDESDSGSDSDTAPDYSLLSATTASRKHALPSRGTKDFEPNPTARQASTLDISRRAMTDALSVGRYHTSKNNENVGVYYSDPRLWDAQWWEERHLASIEDVEKRSKVRASTALKAGQGRCVAVERFTNTYARSMGTNDRRSWMWLLPEEALYLVERGSLDLRYSDHNDDPLLNGTSASAESAELESEADEKTHDDEKEEPRLIVGKVPVSLQGAYAALIGKSGLTLERYIVYANLRRAGYIVQRAPTWHGPVEHGETQEPILDSTAPAEEWKALYVPPQAPQSTSLIYKLLSWLFTPTPKAAATECLNSITGPLISPGLFRSYGDVFRQLHLIPQYNTRYPAHLLSSQSCNHDISEQIADNAGADPPLLPTFYINKPSALQGYKKSSPPPPNYIVCVLDARSSTIPTSTQIGHLLASMPDEPQLESLSKKRLEARIKIGKRSVLFAVVDSGLVSYMRFSGGGFDTDNWL